jgi:YhcH/YjgK/YiaL family protein
MIVTSLSQGLHQIPDHPRLRSALHFLGEANIDELTDGRLEIDGQQVYALVQTYLGKSDLDQVRFEAHQRYLDVQYIHSGKELFGWAPLDLLENKTPYNSEKDVQHGFIARDKQTFVRLKSGMFAIVFPSDAHAPGLADGEPALVKKIVVKVLFD